ncbi:hypothetical protein BDN71DRAFT_1511220 [Pleurotus eryngii]|uniref:Uncharacterized protein n=1 Tax=Pleurotus eryngii TaxID=5323 RepID=A0A9P6D485_PLEER|nr:hypothetical protein BDN71DRAFT_1511220 [Pleurotus eryngii]
MVKTCTQDQCQKAVLSYYHRNQDLLREKARARMARLRASNAFKSKEAATNVATSKRAAQAKYREGTYFVPKKLAGVSGLHPRIPLMFISNKESIIDSKKVLAAIIAEVTPIAYGEDAQCSDVSDGGCSSSENPSESEWEPADQGTQGVDHGGDFMALSPLLSKTTECQEVDWKNHKEVCQPIPRGQHTCAITQFNYRYGRYIHALALHVLGYSELPRSHERRDMTHERLDVWKKTSNRYAVVLHLRQNDHMTHFHPYHDYRLASIYRYHVSLLDIIEQGCKARAQSLLGIRQEKMTCVVVILFENKAGMGIGHSCFLHKVDKFGVNDYPRVSHHIVPQAFRRILLHKARKVRPDNVA